MEIPVRRLLLGAEPAAVADPDAMADPGALDDFLDYARAQQDYTVSA
jgi:acetoacetyl-CoA synthetase